MNKSEDYITIQFGSVSNRVCEQWWTLEAENQLSKDAETEGQPLMNVDSMFLDKKATKPRLLMFDTTDKADRFYFGKSGIADTRNVGVWNNNRIDRRAVEESKEEEEENDRSYEPFEMSAKNLHLTTIFDSQFNNYLSGRYIVDNSETADQIEDKLRFFLERSDYLGGVHSILDVNSGFGSVCKFVLNYLKDEAPKSSILQVSIENELEEQDTDKVIHEMRIVNRLLALDDLKSYCDAYIPVDLAAVAKAPFLNSKYRNPEHHLAFLLSNLTLPYRINSPKEAFKDMKSYLGCLVPSPSNMLVNMYGKIPVTPDDGPESLDNNSTIFEYKEKLRPCFFNIEADKLLKERLTLFGESFVIRGNINSIRYKKINLESSTPLCLWDNDARIQNNFRSLFNPNYTKIYGDMNQLTEQLELNKLPYHSVAINSEVFRYSIKQWLDDWKSVSYATQIQYIKEEFSEDEMKGVSSELSSLIDCYDTSE